MQPGEICGFDFQSLKGSGAFGEIALSVSAVVDSRYKDRNAEVPLGTSSYG